MAKMKELLALVLGAAGGAKEAREEKEDREYRRHTRRMETDPAYRAKKIRERKDQEAIQELARGARLGQRWDEVGEKVQTAIPGMAQNVQALTGMAGMPPGIMPAMPPQPIQPPPVPAELTGQRIGFTETGMPITEATEQRKKSMETKRLARAAYDAEKEKEAMGYVRHKGTGQLMPKAQWDAIKDAYEKQEAWIEEQKRLKRKEYTYKDFERTLKKREAVENILSRKYGNDAYIAYEEGGTPDDMIKRLAEYRAQMRVDELESKRLAKENAFPMTDKEKADIYNRSYQIALRQANRDISGIIRNRSVLAKRYGIEMEMPTIDASGTGMDEIATGAFEDLKMQTPAISSKIDPEIAWKKRNRDKIKTKEDFVRKWQKLNEVMQAEPQDKTNLLEDYFNFVSQIPQYAPAAVATEAAKKFYPAIGRGLKKGFEEVILKPTLQAAPELGLPEMTVQEAYDYLPTRALRDIEEPIDSALARYNKLVPDPKEYAPETIPAKKWIGKPTEALSKLITAPLASITGKNKTSPFDAMVGRRGKTGQKIIRRIQDNLNETGFKAYDIILEIPGALDIFNSVPGGNEMKRAIRNGNATLADALAFIEANK